MAFAVANVLLGQCDPESGEMSGPVGVPIVVGMGWRERPRGAVQSFLNAQTTTISIDGGDPIDISDSYSPIVAETDDEGSRFFVTRLGYDTGMTLEAGESIQVEVTQAVSNVVPAGLADADPPHRPGLFRPGQPQITRCRITAS